MRFQTYLLAAAAALGSTVSAQTSILSSVSDAASSVVSSATATSSSDSSSSTAASTTSAAATSSSSSASDSSSSSSEDAVWWTTRVFTTTYFYLKHNPTYAAVSPTLLVESVVVSTSGASDQPTFSTPTDAITVLSVTMSTYTTTITTPNQYDAVKNPITKTKVVTTTEGIPNMSTQALNAGAGHIAAAAGPIGGVAAFFLGLAALI